MNVLLKNDIRHSSGLRFRNFNVTSVGDLKYKIRCNFENIQDF